MILAIGMFIWRRHNNRKQKRQSQLSDKEKSSSSKEADSISPEEVLPMLFILPYSFGYASKAGLRASSLFVSSNFV